MATKYIFVTGGVVSGLGKGITAASLGRLLKCRGLKVASQKLDPYVNVDPGTMSPLQHGEVFVTDDGTETDLDLGHYERFIDENLNKYSNLTTGKVYWNVLNKERQGAYLGQTVQIIPHITNEIKSYIYNLAASTEADVVITEIGGTTGDIESQPFLEAIRQVGIEQGHENCCYIHVVLVPYISGSNEYKSKPAQHSVKELQGMGISPDIFEAAELDGCGSFRRFFSITLPLIRPILAYTLITSIIGGLQMFDVPQILTNGQGNPDRTSMTLIMFLNSHLKSRNYGMAGALSVYLFIVSGILCFFVYRMTNGSDSTAKHRKHAKGGAKA